jgi:DNA adenine methylase
LTDPILRWAGSKKKLLPVLTAAAPSHFSRYAEPFVGSAVLFLKLDAPKALLGDLNEDLIDAYTTIREHPRAVWNRVIGMSHDPDFYYELRGLEARSLNALDRAARFVYLNRFCFNGVYRTNKQGQFNVPRGSGRLSIPDLATFMGFAKTLKNADLVCGDFETLVRKTKKGDFLYLDPPYALGEKRDRGEYGAGSFREGDEVRLIESISAASKRGVKVLLSYSPSSFVTRQLKGWNVHNISVTRSVAGFSGSRRTAEEILVSNYEWSPITDR